MGGDPKKLEEFSLPPGVAEYLEQRFREVGQALADLTDIVKLMAKEVAEIHAQGGVHPTHGESGKLGKPPKEETAVHPLLMTLVPDYAQVLEVLEDGDVIKATKWLGEDWTPINELLEASGFTWIRDGRKSRWEKKEQ